MDLYVGIDHLSISLGEILVDFSQALDICDCLHDFLSLSLI